MAKKEVTTDLGVARQLDDSQIKYDAQGSSVKEINDALQSASKRGTGKDGYPKYVAIVKDFVIAIENKADLTKHQKLTDAEILSWIKKILQTMLLMEHIFTQRTLLKTVHSIKSLQFVLLVTKSIIKILLCV